MVKTAWGVKRTECKKVAVIGGGNMGGGIAAQFANAGVAVELLDVPGAGPSRNEPAQLGLQRQKSANAFMVESAVEQVRTGNTEDHLDRVAEADWIVEAIIEDLSLKQSLYARIEPLLKPGAIISSNTSTIPRSKLIEGRGNAFQDSFIISHFFNPPRRMELLELVGSGVRQTYQAAADIARVALGKTIVECRDAPGFIANRIGCTWMSVAVTEAVRLGISVEEADAIHVALGLPRTGVFGLLDLVGIDVIPYIWGSLMTNLPEDDLINAYDLPGLGIISVLIGKGCLGRKTGAGFYRRTTNGKREVLDLRDAEYRAHSGFAVGNLPGCGKDLDALLSDDGVHGEYARAVLGNVAAYAIAHANEIAPGFDEIDLAMQLGYAWHQGPIALVNRLAPQTRGMLAKTYQGSGDLVAAPANVAVASADRVARAKAQGAPLASNDSAALLDIGDGLVCLDIRTKMHAIDGRVLDILREGLNALAGSARGMLVGDPNARIFSAGANLSEMAALIEAQNWAAIEEFVQRGQDLFLALSLSQQPSVAAIPGLALGGGCELAMHCTGTVAHAEARLGLPEHMVGLIPGWGGVRRLLSRLNRKGPTANDDLTPRKIFSGMSSSEPTGSAREAVELGLLEPHQEIVMHPGDLSVAAIQRLEELISVSAPREPEACQPLGTVLVSDLVAPFRERHREGKLSSEDFGLAIRVAEVLTGGQNEGQSKVMSEEEFAAYERDTFVSLARNSITLKRIQHMLETGKPLRN